MLNVEANGVGGRTATRLLATAVNLDGLTCHPLLLQPPLDVLRGELAHALSVGFSHVAPVLVIKFFLHVCAGAAEVARVEYADGCPLRQHLGLPPPCMRLLGGLAAENKQRGSVLLLAPLLAVLLPAPALARGLRAYIGSGRILGPSPRVRLLARRRLYRSNI